MRDSKAAPLAHTQSVFHGHLTTFHLGGGSIGHQGPPKIIWLGLMNVFGRIINEVCTLLYDILAVKV